MTSFKRSPLLGDIGDDFGPIAPARLSGCFFGTNSSSSKTQSQQTSAPVINQQGLSDVEQNAANAQGIVNNSFQPYQAPLTAGLTPNQWSAVLGAPNMQYAGLAPLNSAYAGAQGIMGFNPMYASANTAAPGLMGAAPQANAQSYEPFMLGSAPAFSAAQTGSQGYNPALAGNAPNVNASNIAGLMGNFTSPYTQNVIDTTNAQIERNREQAQVANNQSATQAGAFGGARQGVADALTNQLYDMNKAQTDANLQNQGFQTALQGAMTQAANNQQAGQFNAANALQTILSNQNAQNTAGQFGANAANAAGIFNAGALNNAGQYNAGLAANFLQNNQNAANQAGQFNAATGTQNSQFNAGLGANVGEFNAGNQQAANLFNAGALNNMGQFNSGLYQQLPWIYQNAVNSEAALGPAYQNQYGNYLNSMMQTGGAQQQTNQDQLTALYNEFLRAQQYPFMGQQLVNQSLGLVPVNLGQQSQGTSSGQSGSFGFNMNIPGL